MVVAVRALPIVVAVVLGAAPAVADVGYEQIERARSSALTPEFQEELPGQTLLRGEAGDASGTGTGGTGTRRGTTASGRGGQGSADDRARRRIVREQEMRDTRELRRRAEDDGPSSLFSVLMWGLLAVGLGLVAFWFFSEFAKPSDDVALPAGDNDAQVVAKTQAIIDRPLGDADDLAARGEYVEAIHTLLLRTLHELARSAMVRVERSHTSREILARVPLLADARDALHVLITYVELTHFGDEPATESDYARCREQFNRFAEAFRAGIAVQQRMPVAGGTALAS